jgi:hypothetical protein
LVFTVESSFSQPTKEEQVANNNLAAFWAHLYPRVLYPGASSRVPHTQFGEKQDPPPPPARIKLI